MQELPQYPNVAAVFAERQAARRNPLLDRSLGTSWATFSIILSVLIMSYSTLFSVMPILIFLLIWGMAVVMRGLRVLAPTRDMLFCLTVPVLCLVSTLWSDYRGITLYLGTMFVALVVCIIVAARVVRFEALVRGLSIGISIVLALTLMNNNYGADAFDTDVALRGLFGSKNMVGFVAEIGILAAFSVFMMRLRWYSTVMASVVPFIICAVCLYLSRSGTALLSLIAIIGLIGVAFIVTRFPQRIRAALVLLLLILAITIVGAGIILGWEGLMLQLLGKDATLTGRTYLWHEGFNIGLQQPWLGHGYSAFWVQGQPQAERYWHEFFITERTGFHFHSTYVQTFVDLGLIGMGTLALLILTNCVRSTVAVLRNGMVPELVFLLALSYMFLIRSFVEIDFFVGPAGMGTFLFYMILPRLSELRRREKYHAA